MNAAEFDQFCADLEQVSMPTPATGRWWTQQVRRNRDTGMLLLLGRSALTATLFEHLAVGHDYLTVYATEVEPVIYPFPASPDWLQG
jgi:hypothetical protein